MKTKCNEYSIKYQTSNNNICVSESRVYAQNICRAYKDWILRRIPDDEIGLYDCETNEIYEKE